MAKKNNYTWESVANYLGVSIQDAQLILFSSAINDYCATSHVRRTLQVLDGISYADVEADEGVGRNTVRRSIRQTLSSALIVANEMTTREVLAYE